MALSIADTGGALLIGVLVTMTIYGITTLQAYFYYISFPKDGFRLRSLVVFIWLLDTLHAIFMCHSVHSYLIVEYGNPAALKSGNWALFSSIAVNVVMAFVVQCFFTYRIYKLCSPRRRLWIAGGIGFFVLAHFAFGLETVVLLYVRKEFTLVKKMDFSAVPFAGFTILSDISIAVALCILLNGNRSGLEDTNIVINRLIIFAINRCFLTSAMAIIEAIVFTVLPNTFYTWAIDFVIGKLYANSLLAVLNSRATLRSNVEEFSSTEMSGQFHVSSAVVTRQTSFQVRTREGANRSTILPVDEEKNGTGVASSTSARSYRKENN